VESANPLVGAFKAMAEIVRVQDLGEAQPGLLLDLQRWEGRDAAI
jgi:hypothetical protein